METTKARLEDFLGIILEDLGNGFTSREEFISEVHNYILDNYKSHQQIDFDKFIEENE